MRTLWLGLMMFGVIQSGPKVSLTLKESTVKSAISAAAKQAKMRVIYDDAVSRATKRVSIDVKNADLMEALAIVLKGTGLEAKIASDGETIMVGPITNGPRVAPDSQTGRITGRVVDSATGQGISGVTVSVAGINVSTITKIDGTFALGNVPLGDQSISYKLFGYRALTKVTTVVEGKPTTVRVVMATVPTQLSGVVTTATGRQRKVEVGNDIATIHVEEVLRDYPVTTMSDLLATRVPGLVATPASGQPGAPTRIRIHGVSTLSGSNDPIIIVDGVQIVSRRQNETSNMSGNGTTGVGFELSPLDRIDPNAIETVEVLKGPSAVALYGSDAGNGVIVITTKKGDVGPTRWGFSGSYGMQTMPGKWPWNYYAWGSGGGINIPTFCPKDNWLSSTGCRVDSTMVYQILNDPATTIMGRGIEQQYSVNVSGGSPAARYSFTLSSGSVLGLVKLPDQDVQLLEDAGERVAGWQRRPQASNNQNGTIRLDIGAGPSTDIAFTTTFSRTAVRSTPLSGAITSAATFPPAVPVYADGVLVPSGSGLLQSIPDFRERQRTDGMSTNHVANMTIRLPRQMRSTFSAGIDRSTQDNRRFLATGGCVKNTGYTCDDGGYEQTSQTTRTAANLRWNLSAPLVQHAWLNLRATVGSDYNQSNSQDLTTTAKGLSVGATNGYGAVNKNFSGSKRETRTMGAYAEVVVGLANRLYLPFGLRTDAGSTLGNTIRPKLPKLGFSYLLSEQPMFQQLPFIGKIPEVRVRAAYGISGRQPGAGNVQRTYNQSSVEWDGLPVTVVRMQGIGNSRLRPERVQDVDWGIDADLLNGARGRLSVSATWTRKMTTDLLSGIDVPASVGGGYTQTVNLGDLRNTVFDGSLEAAITGRRLTWNPVLRWTRLRNKLVRIATEDISQKSGGHFDGSAFAAVRVGYPVYSRWARPIVGYTDLDGDGFLSRSEVLFGDSAVYLGAPYPRFEIVIDNRVTLLRQVTISAVVKYHNGMTQQQTPGLYERVNNDPTVGLREQAYGWYSDLARIQTVSSCRFESLQLNYILPRSMTQRWLPTRTVTLKVQGQNLGLWTNYRGKDPNVGATRETIRDEGQLPKPRVWSIAMGIN